MNKPYYQDDAVTIYHGDCREILPELPKVDLVLTDPPYMNLKGTKEYPNNGSVGVPGRKLGFDGGQWGASLDWVECVIPVVGLGAMVFCVYTDLPEIAMSFPFRRAALISWHKRNAPPGKANVPRFTEEYVWCFANGVGLKWDVFNTTLIDMPRLSTGCMASKERILNNKGLSAHPCQKPLALISKLLSVGGDTILDPFMGSGTALRAAKDLNRKAVGIEIEEKYCEIAARRMTQEVLPL